MSITALAAGRLLADPERRTGANGKTFVTFRLAVESGEDRVFISGIAFGTAADQMAALGKGDTAAVVGRAKPKAWTGKDGAMKVGIDVVADQVLTAYHLRRKRAAIAGDAEPSPASRSVPRSSSTAGRAGGRGGAEFAEDDEWLRSDS